jgi:hypothetical protein
MRLVISHVPIQGSAVQPTELVAVMAAIIYSGRRDPDSAAQETRQAAVEEAWKIWHLTMEGWTGQAPRPYGPTLEP